MKFINREKELAQLSGYNALSGKRLMVVAISGLRRVGKTTLVREFIRGKKAIYFFVYDSKTSQDLLGEFSGELRKQKIITGIEDVGSWKVFFDVVFTRCRDYVIVFDEFQNFMAVEPSVFSIIQRNCDERSGSHVNLIILGSLIGLFKKIFEDRKQPLYGRISAKIALHPFTLENSVVALKLLGYRDFGEMLKIYSVFGGFPKYYAAIEQFGLEGKAVSGIIEDLFIRENAALEDEVPDILKQEFGRRSSLYYSILHSIASGKTRLGEIADSTGMKPSSITRHLSELEHRFELVRSAQPLGSRKNLRYSITHPLVAFWFMFVYGKFSEYRLRNVNDLMQDIDKGFNTFLGKRFEDICREFLARMDAKAKLPFKLSGINGWWGSARVDGKREEIEIDSVAIGKDKGNVLFAEFKWKDGVDAKEVLEKLKWKAGFVEWQKHRRQEYYCIIAKSFRRKVVGDNVLLFDLKDMAKGFGKIN